MSHDRTLGTYKTERESAASAVIKTGGSRVEEQQEYDETRFAAQVKLDDRTTAVVQKNVWQVLTRME